MIPVDWIFGLIGGLMIGSAAAILLLLNGRIMGASGIIENLLADPKTPSWSHSVAFFAGLVGVPALIALAGFAPATHVTSNPVLLVIAGLSVGFGTRLAGGCTSGHGVCGISRIAPRGIGATLIYLGVGVLTMAVLRHGLAVI